MSAPRKKKPKADVAESSIIALPEEPKIQTDQRALDRTVMAAGESFGAKLFPALVAAPISLELTGREKIIFHNGFMAALIALQIQELGIDLVEVMYSHIHNKLVPGLAAKARGKKREKPKTTGVIIQ